MVSEQSIFNNEHPSRAPVCLQIKTPLMPHNAKRTYAYSVGFLSLLNFSSQLITKYRVPRTNALYKQAWCKNCTEIIPRHVLAVVNGRHSPCGETQRPPNRRTTCSGELVRIDHRLGHNLIYSLDKFLRNGNHALMLIVKKQQRGYNPGHLIGFGEV